MKLGAFAVLFGNRKLETVVETFARAGLETIELGVGAYPGAPHVPVKKLLASATGRDRFMDVIKGAGLTISALSVHGNALHPQRKIAVAHHHAFVDAVRLAKLLKVKTVVTFSGCPGGSPTDKTPNWITCPWPDDFSKALEWQWTERVVPYWKKWGKFAHDNGRNVAFEMHPGFVVYNTETMLRLRSECGPAVGANFDPSHLFWQGIDPLKALRMLKGIVWHVHAKDCRIDGWNAPVNGVLDTKHYGDEINRSWIFRTVGYGHGEEFWRAFVSTLRLIGYDGALSIEHEDSLMSTDEGFAKAVDFLKNIILREKTGGLWWA